MRPDRLGAAFPDRFALFRIGGLRPSSATVGRCCHPVHRVGEVLRGVTSVLLGQALRSLPNVTASPIPVSRSSAPTYFEGLVKFCRTDAPLLPRNGWPSARGSLCFVVVAAAVVFLN